MTGEKLVEIADRLTLGRASASWSDAAGEGFEKLAIPSNPEPKEKSRVQFWKAQYRLSQPDGVAGADFDAQQRLDILVSTAMTPWQAVVTQFSMPVRLVTVNGRAGLLVPGRTDAEGTKSPGALLTDNGDGVQLSVRGDVSSGLLPFAEQVKRVEADDPRIQK